MRIKVTIEVDEQKVEIWEKEISDQSTMQNQINETWDFTKKVSSSIANRGAAWFISQRKQNAPT